MLAVYQTPKPPRPLWQIERDRLLAHAEHAARKGKHYRACLLMIKAWSK